jgi:uncharacterized membrane protein YgcG
MLVTQPTRTQDISTPKHAHNVSNTHLQLSHSLPVAASRFPHTLPQHITPPPSADQCAVRPLASASLRLHVQRWRIRQLTIRSSSGYGGGGLGRARGGGGGGGGGGGIVRLHGGERDVGAGKGLGVEGDGLAERVCRSARIFRACELERWFHKEDCRI